MSGGSLVEIDGERWYRIDDVGRLAPFLMSVVSDGDRWMFVSSSGALTAGRRDATQALFPYVTDDRLHAAGGRTGPVTMVRVDGVDAPWQPFAAVPTPGTTRALAKTVLSDAVRFEERHVELGLTFSYRWSSAEEFGFVRAATLCNDGPSTVAVDVVDGLVDVLPAGLEPIVYQRLSNLTNAYKRSELVDDDTGLAVFTLEAPVSDQAEPEEVLRATTAWSTGFHGDVDLSAAAVAELRSGGSSEQRHLVTGLPGAYLRRGRISLDPGEHATWYVVADVGRDQLDVTRLRHRLRDATDLVADLSEATRRTGDRLASIVGLADARQVTGDDIACAHHESNVIFNVMRGGVPLDGYDVDTADFAAFVGVRNRIVAAHHRAWLGELPPVVSRRDLIERVGDLDDVHLSRLAEEYLPFSFSRRHGDPSRPWNQFSIRITDESGAPLRYYEGNWRDVFQNWEALCASFPDYLPGVVSTFVNASTADGYNPYRITRNGIDWEVPDPDDPWANIGYWGDHQVVYLLRLLEQTEAHQPGLIAARLDRKACTYADVPYRIAPYERLVVDSKDTITFDEGAAARSGRRVEEMGADGKLLLGPDGAPLVVTLAEKLLVTVLARLGNYVPGGGIWMNTQRPEWNDANNALVGSGLSMVTLFHLRRFVAHLRALVEARPSGSTIEMSSEVASWAVATTAALDAVAPDLATGDARERRTLLDRLGAAASEFRSRLYDRGLSGAVVDVEPATILALCDRALVHLDRTVAGARRPDGLVHAYNLLRLPDDDHAAVDHLPEMLEGQVAALTPGLFTSHEQADLVDSLFESALLRDDLGTFVLAPPRLPPAFLDKNVIEPAAVDENALLAALVADGDGSLVRVDADGRHRFAADLSTADALANRLDELGAHDAWAALVERCRAQTLATYENVFGHHAHLGRSGTMYGFEGIGSVYWHMVTKLLLAVQEAAVHASRAGDDPVATRRLVESYWRVRAGLGVDMTPEQFGAIPIDPYSHSPAHAGAQQPGMTGAVKEEILARPRELGVAVDGGDVVFDGLLLRTEELLDRPVTWSVEGVGGDEVEIPLEPGSLGFTLCQVPIVVTAVDGEPSIEIVYDDGRTEHVAGNRLGAAASASVFSRAGEIRVIRARVRLDSPPDVQEG